MAIRRDRPNPLCPLPIEGAALLVDKPSGPTSHDIVNRLRKLFGVRKIGHAGTLDPMATGLLIAALGPATPLLQFLSGLDKEYEGRMILGAVSTTYDAEGSISPGPRPDLRPDRERIESEMGAFVGPILQRPPLHSAVKVQGRPLYDYARKGRPVTPEPRRVQVHAFELTEYAPPELGFRCRVSSGTYVRAMAHDLGQALGCGAYLSALRRTVVGAFRVEEALPLDALESRPEEALKGLLRPAEALRHLPRVEVNDEAALRLDHGGAFDASETTGGVDPPARPGAPVAVVNPSGRLLAVCRSPEPGESFRPLRVFPWQ